MTSLISLPTNSRLCDHHSGLMGGPQGGRALTVKGLCPAGARISADCCQNNNQFVNLGSLKYHLAVCPVPTVCWAPCRAVGRQQVWHSHGDAPGWGGGGRSNKRSPPPAQAAPSPSHSLCRAPSVSPQDPRASHPSHTPPTQPPEEEVSEVETGALRTFLPP